MIFYGNSHNTSNINEFDNYLNSINTYTERSVLDFDEKNRQTENTYTMANSGDDYVSDIKKRQIELMLKNIESKRKELCKHGEIDIEKMEDNTFDFSGDWTINKKKIVSTKFIEQQMNNINFDTLGEPVREEFISEEEVENRTHKRRHRH